MTDAKQFPATRRQRLLPSVFLTLLLAVLLHLLVIDWGQSAFDAHRNTPDQAAVMTVTLQALPLPQKEISLPVAAARPARKPARPARQSAALRQPPPPHAAEPEPDTPIIETVTALAPAAASSANAPAAPSDTAPPAPPDSAAESAAMPAGAHYQLDLPPSAALDFAVHAFSDNLHWYGTSLLSWNNAGDHYTIDGEVYARFFAKITFLTFTSGGELNAFGVAPELYTEKRRNRSATNTHFNRERNLISFSASTATYPRAGGEQDRASLIWQLAAIGRGDSKQFSAGNVIDLFVAGVRDGEVWRMQILGQEDLSLPSGPVSAWHIVRQPRPGSYEQRLDIWLAPQQQWYPVRLRFSETNGDYLDMTLSDLKTR